jgi:pyridoxamine 5'-phosphate oxidase
MSAELKGLREMLRSQRVFPDEMPGFDPQAAPDDPVTLFLRWLEAAIKAGVPAPQAMTLATADERGQPSSRVLICKDVDSGGRWHFASSSASGKGRDLAVNPGAALSFWWPQQGRQIRIRGTAVPAGEHASAADFLARPPASRAEGWSATSPSRSATRPSSTGPSGRRMPGFSPIPSWWHPPGPSTR